MAANIPLTNTASLTPDTQLASAPISPESRRFLRHVTAATAFGGGLDGFDLGVISVVILHINHDLELTPAMEGLVGAASLLGIFIGAPLFGFLTDKFGRRRMFLVDIIAFIVIGAGQAFATGGVSLGILRFLLGMAIGAESTDAFRVCSGPGAWIEAGLPRTMLAHRLPYRCPIGVCAAVVWSVVESHLGHFSNPSPHCAWAANRSSRIPALVAASRP